MAAPKAKTNLEKLGFLDPDRKNPTHDEIQIWVLSNIEKIINHYSKFEVSEIISVSLENPVFQNNNSYYSTKYIVGYIDVCAVIKFKGIDREFVLYIEIKSKIDSFGDLVRQIQTYKTYLGQNSYQKYIVISPDDKYKDALKTQNILFFHYPHEL